MSETKRERKVGNNDVDPDMIDALEGEMVLSIKDYKEDNVAEAIKEACGKIARLIVQISKGVPQGVAIAALKVNSFECVKFDANVTVEYIAKVIPHLGQGTQLIIPGDCLPDKAKKIAALLPAPDRALYVALPLGDDGELMNYLAENLNPRNRICLKHLNVLIKNDVQNILKNPVTTNKLQIPLPKLTLPPVTKQLTVTHQRLLDKLKEKKQDSVASTNTAGLFSRPTSQSTGKTAASTEAEKPKEAPKAGKTVEPNKNKKKKHKKKKQGTSVTLTGAS